MSLFHPTSPLPLPYQCNNLRINILLYSSIPYQLVHKENTSHLVEKCILLHLYVIDEHLYKLEIRHRKTILVLLSVEERSESKVE